jgi:SNF2 family DNA or RNA helicase
MHERMATRLEDDSVVISTNNLARNTRLMQFASAYAYVNEEGDVRLSEPSPKLDTMMEIIEDMGGRPIVIAAQSRQLIELAAARLEAKKIEHRLVTGRVTGPERDRAIDDFQAGRAQVMLLTVAAGGVGITLTAADTIVFLQRSWRMIDNRQAEDRVHRIGSGRHESIVIIDMITKNTIEEEQIPKLQEKLRRLQELQRDIEVARANGELEIVAKLEAEENAIDQSPIWATGDKTDGSSLSDEVIADALNMAGLVG